MKPEMHINNNAPVVAANTAMSRRDAEKLLATEVASLFNYQPDDNLRWQGTTIDLMECLHVAFLRGVVTDDDGIGLSFNDIVDRACTLLHVVRPSNPYEVAQRAYRRKGFRQLPFVDRYHRRLLKGASSHPFLALVGHS